MDEHTLGLLLDQHAAALTLYARQWCAAPEDVVQEAFLKLIAQRRLPPTPVPWLYRVVRTTALDAARAAGRRRRHEERAGRRAPAWFVPGDDAALDSAAVARALQELSAEPREAITLHLWGGLSFAEIGDVMDCAPSTAHRWYQSGLEILRQRISPCPNNPGSATSWNEP